MVIVYIILYVISCTISYRIIIESGTVDEMLIGDVAAAFIGSVFWPLVVIMRFIIIMIKYTYQVTEPVACHIFNTIL